MSKRRRYATEQVQHTPRKRRQLSQNSQLEEEDTITLRTPTRDSGQSASTPGRVSSAARSQRHTKAGDRLAQLNDRSARKKSAAVLSTNAVIHDNDQDASAPAETALAQAILSDDDVQGSAAEDDQAEAGAEQERDDETAAPTNETLPTKRPRGRPKGKRKERTPTPPPDLPAHELYFFHNRTTAGQTSTNTLPAHALLNHEDYLAQIKSYQDPHHDDMQRLNKLHFRSFEQWHFELDQNLSLCLYGLGSKRKLIMDFVDYVHQCSTDKMQIVVVNGYNTSISIKDVLATVASCLFDEDTTLPGQPTALLEAIVRQSSKSNTSRIMLVVHNLDSINLRKGSAQAMMARLASLSCISLLASCDSLNFALMWDIALLRQFNFAYHDATTFEPWTVEIETVEEVNALIGRSSRRLAGKDGVGYVLRSLPENARSLFRVLIAEQLALGDIDFSLQVNGNAYDDDGEDADLLGASDEEMAARQQNTPSKRGRGRPKKTNTPAKVKASAPVEGVEYRTLYHKAVEEFICSSEVNFRTLLKEFHDHQMIESRKDSMGTERLIVPFRREELEAILEEL